MNNPLRGIGKFKSPASYNKIQNPLTNGERIKRLKAMHARNLAASGLKEPKSPI